MAQTQVGSFGELEKINDERRLKLGVGGSAYIPHDISNEEAWP